MPTCIAAVAGFLLLLSGLPLNSPIVIAAAAITLGGLAYYDTLLGCQQRQVSKNTQPGEFECNVVIFFLVQLFIVPLILGALVMGFCKYA